MFSEFDRLKIIHNANNKINIETFVYNFVTIRKIYVLRGHDKGVQH